MISKFENIELNWTPSLFNFQFFFPFIEMPRKNSSVISKSEPIQSYSKLPNIVNTYEVMARRSEFAMRDDRDRFFRVFSTIYKNDFFLVA